ncbi:hypothetical protein COY28_06300 [Candidatus Woesearchaeota archaeon CG_4_10_14_0_2_um_filter_57_5]|nr:MAG: hypothetical protein AUJ68_03760 [Candidatus Woesearchaeota archaeon CG1_02_57_44]PIN69071.1 MAG: hypothetical protein COV94_03340 [Candidatus Woesearchaeota archaeon CG11_big_fil_rev_8_21_14_0_20_57_5]PIZ49444.1 MAG: hypothetical protein COY28_06300 [Candidatus Woesearchaeota archaeon CG_4_10_14_0_2_um_filter_57_5]
MKALLIAPAIALLIIGAAMQLSDIATRTSSKAIAFADDMDSAMHCTMHGQTLDECAPQLLGYDFEPEAKETMAQLQILQDALRPQLEAALQVQAGTTSDDQAASTAQQDSSQQTLMQQILESDTLNDQQKIAMLKQLM